MANLKRLSLALPVFLLLLYLAYLGALILIVKPADVEQGLIRDLKSYRGTNLQLQGFSLSYFPSLKVHAKSLIIEIPGDPHLKLEAKNFRVKLSGLMTLLGKTSIQGVEFEDADLLLAGATSSVLKTMTLNDLIFKIGAVRNKKPIRFEAKAAFADVPNVIALKGFFQLERLEDWKWREVSIDGDMQLRHLILSSLSHQFKTALPFKVVEGQVESSVRFLKKSNDLDLVFSGKADIDQFSYEIQENAEPQKSPAIKGSGSFELGWNPETDVLKVIKATVDSPLGRLEAIGKYLLNTREFKDFRMTASNVLIENFPQYILPLKKALPFNIGFSGASTLEMSLEGSFDHASIDANWDLTPALLTYGRYFSKPKDYPMSILFNCLLENTKQLSGDFSIRLQNTSFKGTVTHFDLKQGKGELNMITNKFKLAGWEKLIPPLHDSTIDGEMKVLVNWIGDDAKGATPGQNILNVSLENGSLSSKDWTGIKQIQFGFDLSPLAFELKHASGMIKDSKIGLDLTIYNFSENLNMRGRLTSPKFKLSDIYEAFSKLGVQNLSPFIKEKEAGIRFVSNKVFPFSEPLENFAADFHFQKNVFVVDQLELSAYGGTGKAKMEFDYSKTPMTYKASAEINKVSLARYSGNGKGLPKAVLGDFFLSGTIMGEEKSGASFSDMIQANGNFSITSGEFQSFDILSAIGEIDGFGEVGLLSNKKTAFDDFRGKFNYQDSKLKLEDATMLSSDLALDATGEVLSDGLLNFKINSYLSSTLTGHFLTPILGKTENFQNKQFGPIPLLLAGPIQAPEIKADARQLEQLKGNLLRKKTQRILRNFVPEEAVFQASSAIPKKE